MRYLRAAALLLLFAALIGCSPILHAADAVAHVHQLFFPEKDCYGAACCALVTPPEDAAKCWEIFRHSAPEVVWQ
jgi:hypothetical protein